MAAVVDVGTTVETASRRLLELPRPHGWSLVSE